MAMMKLKSALIACSFLFLLPFIFGAGCPNNPCQNNPCDDGLYCNGVEVCTVDGNQAVCSDGSPPCEEGEECNEETDSCEAAECETDDDCDDGDLCTENKCDDGTCVNDLVECPEGETCNPITGECEGTITMVSIPGGTFEMGCSPGDSDCEVDEFPHTVTISAFKMSAYEITQGQWETIMGYNPSRFAECGSSCPVEFVSWNDIQDLLMS